MSIIEMIIALMAISFIGRMIAKGFSLEASGKREKAKAAERLASRQ